MKLRIAAWTAVWTLRGSSPSGSVLHVTEKSALPQMPHRPAIECCCGGQSREMGLAQGASLRAKITLLHYRLRDLDAFRIEQPAWLPYPLFLRLAEDKMQQALQPALRRDDPGNLARIEGIAEGADVPLRSVCLLNAMEALLASTEGRIVAGPSGGCSALAVRGSCSRTGELILAKNFDYFPLIQPFYVLRESRPVKGWRSLEFTVAPLAGAVDGVNEKGLCITLNYALMTRLGQPAPLITMAIAEALAKCSTVAEATDLISRRPRWGAGILMLGDASGGLAALELSSTRSAVRPPVAGQDWLAFTNVCTCPETRACQVPDTTVFSERVPPALRGRPVLQWHAERARRIEALVEKQVALGPEDLAVIMADHGPNGVPDGTSPCVHTDYWRTTACLQWFPAGRSVRVAYSTACAAEYVEFAL